MARGKRFARDLSPTRTVALRYRSDGRFDLSVPNHKKDGFHMIHAHDLRKDEVSALLDILLDAREKNVI